MTKTKTVRRRKKGTKPTFRRGDRVVQKDDPDGKVGVFLSGPPALIGSTTGKGEFPPLELKGMVYVRWPFKGGEEFVCIEKVDKIIHKPKKAKKG